MAEIHASNARFAQIIGLIRHLIAGTVILVSIYLIFEGIKPILGREASAIRAFATVVRTLSLDRIILAMVSFGPQVLGFWSVKARSALCGKNPNCNARLKPEIRIGRRAITLSNVL